MRRRELAGRSALFLAALGAVLASLTGVAFATFSRSAAASHTLATGTLAAPTAATTAHGPCTVALSASIVVSWTATSSTWADGYQVLRSLVAGGPYTAVGTVSGQATTSYTDSGLLFSTTYYYVVKATKSQWRSPATAETSRTTKTVLCL